jgi:hypothetical protein
MTSENNQIIHVLEEEVQLVGEEMEMLTAAYKRTYNYREEEVHEKKVVEQLNKQIKRARKHIRSAQQHLTHSSTAQQAAESMIEAAHAVKDLVTLEEHFRVELQKHVQNEEAFLSVFSKHTRELHAETGKFAQHLQLTKPMDLYSVRELTEKIHQHMEEKRFAQAI